MQIKRRVEPSSLLEFPIVTLVVGLVRVLSNLPRFLVGTPDHAKVSKLESLLPLSPVNLLNDHVSSLREFSTPAVQRPDADITVVVLYVRFLTEVVHVRLDAHERLEIFSFDDSRGRVSNLSE